MGRASAAFSPQTFASMASDKPATGDLVGPKGDFPVTSVYRECAIFR